jgi:hypothetical protein
MDTRLLFETPWWLPTVVVLVGTVIFYTANKRRETKLRAGGLAVAALGIGLALVSYFVDTDQERVVKRTRQLVTAFEQKDWERLRSLLHPRVSLSIANLPVTIYSDREQLVARAKDAADRYGFQSVNITSIDARQDQTLITVTLNVLSIQEQTAGRPITSSWEFDWLESADGWALYKIRAIQVANQQADRIEPMFPGGRR